MVVDALNAVDHRNGCWYFCTGNGKPATAVAHWHRSRDSFAVSLLEQGVSIETVSMLLGHSGIRITLRDCRPWVKSPQDHLETEVQKAWVAEAAANSGL
jgi:integrase